MAIENVWIIDANSGICIYDWFHETKVKTIDEQLVSGLLLAFKNFSSEAGLVDISAIEGVDRKLAYKTDGSYIIASICHSKDYEPLVNKKLMTILSNFQKKYKRELATGLTDVSPYKTFDNDLVEMLEGSTSSRNVISTSVGVIVGMVTIGLFFLIYGITIPKIISAIPNSGNIIGLTMLLVGFIIAGFISGLIAGERKYGMIAAFISVIPIFALFVAFFSDSWNTIENIIFNSLLYLLLFSITALIGGLFGGFLKEQRFFFPLTDITEVELSRKKVSYVEDE